MLSWRMVDLMTLSRQTGRSDLPCGQMVAEALRVWSGGSEAGRPVVPLQRRAWSWGHGDRAGREGPPKQATGGKPGGPEWSKNLRVELGAEGPHCSWQLGPEAGRD